MIVGIPKEVKPQEFRVGLNPASVREVVGLGHRVMVEAGAGAGINESDDAYRSAGAVVVGSADEVFAKAELIVKVKEPQPSERQKLTPRHILFTYLHLAPDPDQARDLLRSGATAIAYETVTGPQGRLPLLAPMSEVAGRLAVEAAALSLRRHSGGRGLLLGERALVCSEVPNKEVLHRPVSTPLGLNDLKALLKPEGSLPQPFGPQPRRSVVASKHLQQRAAHHEGHNQEAKIRKTARNSARIRQPPNPSTILSDAAKRAQANASG